MRWHSDVKPRSLTLRWPSESAARPSCEPIGSVMRETTGRSRPPGRPDGLLDDRIAARRRRVEEGFCVTADVARTPRRRSRRAQLKNVERRLVRGAHADRGDVTRQRARGNGGDVPGRVAHADGLICGQCPDCVDDLELVREQLLRGCSPVSATARAAAIDENRVGAVGHARATEDDHVLLADRHDDCIGRPVRASDLTLVVRADAHRARQIATLAACWDCRPGRRRRCLPSPRHGRGRRSGGNDRASSGRQGHPRPQPDRACMDDRLTRTRLN